MHRKQEIKRLRIERIKLQIDIMELERKIEIAYNIDPSAFKMFIDGAEELIKNGKHLLKVIKF
jgi:hypothetical protein